MSEIVGKMKASRQRILELHKLLADRGVFVNLAPNLEMLTLSQLQELEKWLSKRLGK